LSIRPLPPEDPTDNPEQRANRIRSFYKDYSTTPSQVQLIKQVIRKTMARSISLMGLFLTLRQASSRLSSSVCTAMTRRAMTPPPRAPPRFQAPRHQSTMSNGRFMPPGPRAFSSELGRSGPAGRGPPRKPMPPPAPLRVPTPHLLQEDLFTLPIDFCTSDIVQGSASWQTCEPSGWHETLFANATISSSACFVF
jgi:hypothetical protein